MENNETIAGRIIIRVFQEFGFTIQQAERILESLLMTNRKTQKDVLENKN